MKRPVVAVLSTLALGLAQLALAGSAGAAPPDWVGSPGGRPLTVVMTGAAERPGPGDPDGSGTATFRVNPGQERICYTLSVEDIVTPTAAHIHVAGVDAPGPVVVPLTAPTDGTSSGCAEVERTLARDIVRNPEDYYVNVHNAEFPPGAVRGQLG